MDKLIDFHALIIQSINLLVVLWVLRRFLFVPYLAFLDREKEKREKLQKDIADSAHIVDAAQKKANDIIASSRTEAKTLANEILQNARDEALLVTEEANKEAENARQRGFADVEHERKMMAEELKKRVVDVAIAMNKKLFGSSEKNEEFLKNAQKDITL